MNIPSPAQVAANRTARLVREAQTPVYSTETAKAEREHLTAIEIDSGCGRYWITVRDDQVDAAIDEVPQSYGISDIDHSGKCWCFK
jgi:hypothetical protein